MYGLNTGVSDDALLRPSDYKQRRVVVVDFAPDADVNFI